MTAANRGTWVYCKTRKTHIPKEQAQRERAIEAAKNRSDLPCPMIISDQLDGLKSMVDGQIYTSKRAYYDSVKARGLEIVGNEDLTKYAPAAKPAVTPDDIAADVKTAIEQVEAGYVPPSGPVTPETSLVTEVSI